MSTQVVLTFHRSLWGVCWSLVTGALMGLVAGSVVCDLLRALQPDPGFIIGSSAALGTIIGLFVNGLCPWTTAEFHGTGLRLWNRLGQSREIAYDEVAMIVGHVGVNLDGGQMLVWKRTQLVTTHGAPVIVTDYQHNYSFYAALIQACPLAIGVRVDGNIDVPPVDSGTSGLEWVESGASLVRKALLRQARAAVWLAFSVGPLGFATHAVVLFIKHADPRAKDLGRALYFNMVGFVSIVLALMLLYRSIRHLIRGLRIQWEVNRFVQSESRTSLQR